MPEVNTNTNGSLSEDEWNLRKSFIDAYREHKVTGSAFCVLWGSCQMVSTVRRQLEEGQND